MQTIGERLEEARKKKGISIREAAEATKIRGDYLQKFESNQFDIGLTEIYARGFLRNYANYLKIPADRILADYAALGRGTAKPRPSGREVYGRMDITVSTPDATERVPSPDNPPGADPASARTPQPRTPRRSGYSLPAGLDPVVVFKYVKWAGIAIGVLLVILILKAIFGGGSAGPAQRAKAPNITTPASTQKTITLVALDAVYARVSNKNPDGSEGTDLFKGSLTRGQTQAVPWTGPLYINFSAGENLEIEFQGRRNPTNMRGTNRVQLEAPKVN
ncbi:MAG: helix-turn-helix domain-containing protein [Opitutaceae bacterium]